MKTKSAKPKYAAKLTGRSVIARWEIAGESVLPEVTLEEIRGRSATDGASAIAQIGEEYFYVHEEKFLYSPRGRSALVLSRQAIATDAGDNVHAKRTAPEELMGICVSRTQSLSLSYSEPVYIVRDEE